MRQAIAKSIVAYYQKYVDEYAKNQLKQALVQYDRTLLVADNRRCEPKKFGGMPSTDDLCLMIVMMLTWIEQVLVQELATKNHTDDLGTFYAAIESTDFFTRIPMHLFIHGLGQQ